MQSLNKAGAEVANKDEGQLTPLLCENNCFVHVKFILTPLKKKIDPFLKLQIYISFNPIFYSYKIIKTLVEENFFS